MSLPWCLCVAYTPLLTLASSYCTQVRNSGTRHKLREVTEGYRSLCCIASCRNKNSRMGCLTCNLFLCSPECIEDHLYGSPVIIPAKGPIKFNEVSAFKEKKKAQGRAHERKPAPAQRGKQQQKRRRK